MLWIRLFLPFAGAYFLSYRFRTVNAVIGPILSRELSLGAADLGLLTSAYFVGFGAAQMPLGVLLDRFGARRVEPALLLVAATGAVIFASAHSITVLAIGRGMIGVGVSACLMAAFKSFSQWFAPEKQSSLTGWIMSWGTFGALAASAPMEWVLHVANWREVFFGLAGVTGLVAFWLNRSVPDKPGIARPDPIAAQWAGIREVLRSRYFWRYAPFGFAQIGGFMAVQSLWSIAWLMHVNGFTRAEAANHQAAMSMAMLVSYVLIGLLATRLARRGISTLHLMAGGMAMSLLTLLLIITQTTDHHYALWVAYGLFSSFGTLSYAQTAAGFPVALSGRANTSYNLMAFIGAFSLQWGMGGIIDLRHAQGGSAASGYRDAFIVLFIVQLSAYLWLLFGGRKNSGQNGCKPL